MRFRKITIGRLAACVPLLVALGCTVTLQPPGGGGGSGGGNNGGGTPAATTVKVRIVNQTDVGLDPDIHITGQAVTDPSQLFTAGNKYTRFGLLGRGILGGRDTAEFDLDCSAVRVIGTPGGMLGDDLNAPSGSGQQRLLVQDTNFACGEILIFTFSRSGGGFATSVTVTR